MFVGQHVFVDFLLHEPVGSKADRPEVKPLTEHTNFHILPGMLNASPPWPLRPMFFWLLASSTQPCASFSRPSFSVKALAGRGSSPKKVGSRGNCEC